MEASLNNNRPSTYANYMIYFIFLIFGTTFCCFVVSLFKNSVMSLSTLKTDLAINVVFLVIVSAIISIIMLHYSTLNAPITYVKKKFSFLNRNNKWFGTFLMLSISSIMSKYAPRVVFIIFTLVLGLLICQIHISYLSDPSGVTLGFLLGYVDLTLHHAFIWRDNAYPLRGCFETVLCTFILIACILSKATEEQLEDEIPELDIYTSYLALTQ